ncbi:hypothetical protein DPMN_122740 [Dreissena polymorpha]|uniref:Uncharacterized protein n=1 Tax=Dreissena polymorpha TaxID=45954 RepID=A0A9D4JUR5_DREPO|nr:hypothetical protein DPMN_122740 [Dreissena polymorpha]
MKASASHSYSTRVLTTNMSFQYQEHTGNNFKLINTEHLPRPKAEDGYSRSEYSVSPGGHFRGTVGPESLRFSNPHYQRQTRSMDSIIPDPGLCQAWI